MYLFINSRNKLEITMFLLFLYYKDYLIPDAYFKLKTYFSKVFIPFLDNI